MPLAFPARMLLCVARLALPQACALCGALCGNMSQWALCRGCDAAYWNEPRQRCRVCALPLAAAHAGGRAGIRGRPHYVCVRCERLPPPFDATLALADYRPPLDRLALALKFRRRLFVARELAARLAQRAQDEFDREPNPEVVAPVPLAHERLVERGYNQAWEIAKPLARLLGVRADATLLRRVAHTAPQSKLDLDARRRNVGDAFAVTRPVAGAHVALVDDVMTSGSTLEAAARALKAAGAQRVTNFVALRTPRD
ncbi:ComF family protein [Trinickia caryophylli]|uniref:ComF family protein n=1 Tax=Trinickia caryophylli TaxID=28094 RepID=UPI0015920C1E